VLVDRMAWFLRCADLSAGLDALVGRYQKGLRSLAKVLPDELPEFMAGRVASEEARLCAGGVPRALASRIALLPMLAAGTDLILIAERTGRNLAAAATAYYKVAERFRIGRVIAMLDAIEPAEYYERLAVDKASDSLGLSQRQMAESVLAARKGAPDIAAWEGTKDGRVADLAERIDTLLADGRATIAKATVAAGLLAEMAAR